MIKFTDCDLYVNREHQTELRERIGAETAERVPHLFVEGLYIGVSSAVPVQLIPSGNVTYQFNRRAFNQSTMPFVNAPDSSAINYEYVD